MNSCEKRPEIDNNERLLPFGGFPTFLILFVNNV